MARIVMVLLLVSFVSGCATTRQRSNVEQLQIRVAELENAIAERDEEIADLHDELDYLNREARRRETLSDEIVALPRKTDGEIIRIDVSPGQVQVALKNAGFYNGPIDSKVGSGTKAAIKQFQKANGLKSDGIVGRRTWEKLSSYLR